MPPPWLFDVAQELAEQKRHHPDDSLRSLAVHDQTLGLSAMNINTCFVVFALAGHETTRSTAAHFVGLIQAHPDRYAVLRSDLDAHLENAIGGVMRFTSTTTNSCRSATCDSLGWRRCPGVAGSAGSVWPMAGAGSRSLGILWLSAGSTTAIQGAPWALCEPVLMAGSRHARRPSR